MKAIVIASFGGPEVLRIQDRELPVVGNDDVLIRVRAAGVNRPDVIQRQGKYAAPAGTVQDIPGLEVAGVVEACGSNVSRWKKGDAVCALISGGGYAEYVAANALHCLPVPHGWSFVEAASLPETVFTVWHNVFQRGQLQRGEHFLVHGGSSGIGITAIQLAHAFGAKVFATAGSAEKCAACVELGAEICVDHTQDDFEPRLKEQGVDVILDMIGGDYSPRNIRLLRPEGRLVYINSMKGSTSSVSIRDIMQKRLTITGSTLRSRNAAFKAELARAIGENVWPVIERKAFRAVIYKTFPLEDARKAHELMESSKHIGKIVLTMIE